MTVFVNKEAAKNLAANQIAIKKSVVAVDRPTTYQVFFCSAHNKQEDA